MMTANFYPVADRLLLPASFGRTADEFRSMTATAALCHAYCRLLTLYPYQTHVKDTILSSARVAVTSSVRRSWLMNLG